VKYEKRNKHILILGHGVNHQVC